MLALVTNEHSTLDVLVIYLEVVVEATGMTLLIGERGTIPQRRQRSTRRMFRKPTECFKAKGVIHIIKHCWEMK